MFEILKNKKSEKNQSEKNNFFKPHNKAIIKIQIAFSLNRNL